MKVNCWEKCFLCLTNLASTSSSSSSSSCGGKEARGRTKQIEVNGKPNLSVLIKYLLGSWDQSENDSLLQRIRQLLQANSTCRLFCDECQDSARQISHLQMELEVIQMKIVDILRSVRKTVIGNFNGNDGTSRMSLEEFTEEMQEILDTLHAFQAAVVETSKESVHVPLLYIEKFTGYKNLKTSGAIPTPNAEEDEHLNTIKTEPEADSLQEILSDLGDDHDYAASPAVEFNEDLEDDDFLEERMEMDTNNDVNMMPMTPGQAPLAPPTPPRKRGRPRKNPPVEEIKEEHLEFVSLISEPNGNLNPIIKQANFTDGTRKAWSSAQTAVNRIAEFKKSSRASFQYRPRKVPNKARKNKEIDAKINPTPESSSTSTLSLHHPHPPNPAKKTPKQAGKKSSTSKKAVAAASIKKHFQCELCRYKTVNNFEFEHHLTQHESPEVVNHICPHSTNPPRQFSQMQSFDYHMNSHSGLNKMRCELCPKFIDPFGLLEHLRGHSNVEKVFQCSCCSYLCGTREAYLKHIGYHTTSALVCDVCSKRFRKRQRMLEHMHEEHKLLEKIKCDVANCDKEFLDTVTMKAHKKRHTEAFFCSECNVQFPGMKHLLDHQVQEHSREKPFPCSECPETFFEKQSLQRHLINAHGAAKFKCPHCPKEFASQVHLNSHVNLHEIISFPCDKCDKAFGDRNGLRSHQVVHNTTKDFICEECGKAFRYANLLRAHIKIHIGDKKHKCSYCPKAFVDRQNLKSHERIHTGEKPYVCEACGKDFNQRSALNVHMRRQHKELIAMKNKSEVTATGSTSASSSSSTLDELNVG